MKNIKAYIAEAIGTFVLVFVACGVAALTGGNLVPTALAFGFVIFAMAVSIGRISGCHINPAVSLGCLLTGRMSVKDFIGYVVAQIIGGAIGALAIFGIYAMAGVAQPVLETGASNFIIGGEYDALKLVASLLVEAVLTFIFVYVILNVTDKDNESGKLAPVIIGITLTLVHLLGIGLTGTSVNPARSIATALANLVYGGEIKALSQVWVFIVGPLVGAAASALVFKALHGKKEAK